MLAEPNLRAFEETKVTCEVSTNSFFEGRPDLTCSERLEDPEPPGACLDNGEITYLMGCVKVIYPIRKTAVQGEN